MKIAKKKLVFLGIVIVILIFIIIYGWMAFGETAENENQLEQTTVPLLEENQKEYKTRMEAVDNLKEKKPSNAPSMYAEYLLLRKHLELILTPSVHFFVPPDRHLPWHILLC